MAEYNNYPRAVLNTSHPMYGGGLEGFSVGDLPSSYQTGLTVFDAVSANSTSAKIPAGANAIEITTSISDNHTSFSLGVYKDDGTTLLHQYDKVNSLTGDLYLGFAQQRVVIGGGDLIFKITNYDGAGKVSIGVRKTG